MNISNYSAPISNDQALQISKLEEQCVANFKNMLVAHIPGTNLVFPHLPREMIAHIVSFFDTFKSLVRFTLISKSLHKEMCAHLEQFLRGIATEHSQPDRTKCRMIEDLVTQATTVHDPKLKTLHGALTVTRIAAMETFNARKPLDVSGNTLLHLVARNENLVNLSFILKSDPSHANGAQLMTMTRNFPGQTPFDCLMLGASTRSVDLSTRLDNQHNTLLHWATTSGNLEHLKSLTSHRDPDTIPWHLQNFEQQTPLDISIARQDHEMIAYILNKTRSWR